MKRYRIIRDDDDYRYELEPTNSLQTAKKRKSEGNQQFISRYYRIYDTKKNCFVESKHWNDTPCISDAECIDDIVDNYLASQGLI